ncbi:helix-turn-helix domain-containing protein [Epibacterium sp. MM17-32]|uniref:helix-turn-helix domain-containing protein n=1 Tax=Epibacterium sp. MM17-32 TaxID=2917734 RepID=UPI001EF72AE7|nr:helix-turn-helix domain-containing protein [Epibacterium sp. MM17-32]MCG7628374.1 helix-turn-helix domain-containing protein [Epibacterium sp. MM17-32]
MTHSLTLEDCCSTIFGSITIESAGETTAHIPSLKGGVVVRRSKHGGGDLDLNLSQTKQIIAFLQQVVADQEKAFEPEEAPQAEPKKPVFGNLSVQARTVCQHMRRAGSISAREAMDDYGITSATLARRVCDIEEEGYRVVRDRKVHPITGKRYTRYALAA